MNVFLLSTRARNAARYHSNKHVIKMILETAQLLCTAHAMLDHNGLQVPVDAFDPHPPSKTYRPTHKNHPWAIAVRRDLRLYVWVARLGLELCREYSRRYAGKKHASQQLLECLLRVPPRSFKSPTFEPESFSGTTAVRRMRLKTSAGVRFDAEVPLAMPEDSSASIGCAVQAYREYYKTKDAINAWEPRASIPKWYSQ